MAIGNQADIIASFEKLGLSSNEARVYLALLENHPITGYQLSKDSGILRPVVYEMLNRLVEKGGARIIKSNPDTYIPVEIGEFLKNIEAEFSESRERISKELSGFNVTDNTDFFWNILGRKNIVNSVLTMVENAKTEILVSAQMQEHLDAFIKPLDERVRQGLRADIFSYYTLETRSVTLYSYQVDSRFRYPDIHRDTVILVSDASESMIINFSDDKNAKAVYTRNESLVRLARENTWKNIYFIRLWKNIGSEKLKILMSNEDRRLLEAIERYLDTGRQEVPLAYR